jgi:hypothetical protein
MQHVSIDQTHVHWKLGHEDNSAERLMLVALERLSQGTWRPHLHVTNED